MIYDLVIQKRLFFSSYILIKIQVQGTGTIGIALILYRLQGLHEIQSRTFSVNWPSVR